MRYDNEKTILQMLKMAKKSIIQYFNQFSCNCESQFRKEIREMFDVLESDGIDFIDNGYDGEQLVSAIRDDQDRLSAIVQRNFQVIIHNESIDLREKIEREMKKIKEVAKECKIQLKGDARYNVELSKVLDELSFGVTDFVQWATYLGSSFAVGWTIAAGANWWNPVGWGLAAIGALIWIFGDSKKQKAKKQLRQKITEAKLTFFSDRFQEMMRELNNQIDRQKNSIITNVDRIIEQTIIVINSTDDLINDLETMSGDLK